MAKTLSKRDMYKIMAHTLCDVRTMLKAYRGEAMRPSAHDRIATAAKELKLPAPMPLVVPQLGRPPKRKAA